MRVAADALWVDRPAVTVPQHVPAVQVGVDSRLAVARREQPLELRIGDAAVVEIVERGGRSQPPLSGAGSSTSHAFGAAAIRSRASAATRHVGLLPARRKIAQRLFHRG